MTAENARRVADGVLLAAGVVLVLAVWRQPRLRETLRRVLPPKLREIGALHVAAVLVALAEPDIPTDATVQSTRDAARATRTAPPRPQHVRS